MKYYMTHITKPLSFPMEQNHNLGKIKGLLLSQTDSYRRLVGRLIYLTITWPDLAYSVQVLSQFASTPIGSLGCYLPHPSLHQKYSRPRPSSSRRFWFTILDLLWLWLGQLPYHPAFFDRFLFFLRPLFLLLEIKEETYCIPFFRWSWISIYGYYLLWI